MRHVDEVRTAGARLDARSLQILELRKRGVPFEEIARLVGVQHPAMVADLYRSAVARLNQVKAP